MELIRQPVFLLLMTGSVLFEIFLAVPYYFAFGDEMKLVKTSALAVMLLSGLFGAVLSASSSLAREIRSGTALAVLSKPVGRAQFLLAKFAGLAAALALLAYVNLVGVMLASWMAFDAYGSTNLTAIGIFGGGILLAYALAGFSNFFLRRPFVSDAVIALVIMVTLATFVIFQFTHQMQSLGQQAAVDWRLIPGGNFNFVRALDSRRRRAGVLDAAGHDCDAGHLLGDFSGRADVGLFFRPARRARQLVGFDALQHRPELAAFLARRRARNGQKHIPMGLRRQGASATRFCYAGAALAVGVALFDERELS